MFQYNEGSFRCTEIGGITAASSLARDEGDKGFFSLVIHFTAGVDH